MTSDAPFDAEAGRFLAELARHNDREWFTANRARYDDLIAGPMRGLLAGATDRYGPGRVMRPNRDVRFSADKAPYKTTASMWSGSVGGVYLQLDSGGLEVGGGLYDPTRDQLQRAREAIDTRPTAATQLAAALQRLEQAGFGIAGPALTTAPRGFPRDHPSIELLRLRHYAATTRLPVTTDLASIEAAWQRCAALIAWAEQHVGPALAWP